MPTVPENRIKWAQRDWALEGHEWSPGGSRGGTELLWWRSIRPRIHSLLPANDILEIGPGFGRWTAFLLQECERLVAVDVTDRCVEVCRARFADAAADFWVNDGESLPMIPPHSIDVAFSFDSLVHVEASQIRSYLHELRRVLRPGGFGFFHHSNLGAYANEGTVAPYVTKRHWRAASVSARLFREACRDAGLVCLSQEVINWIGRGENADRHRLPGDLIPLTDCFSTFVSPPPDIYEPTQVYVNRRFVEEWRELLIWLNLYTRIRPESSGDPRELTASPASAAVAGLRMIRRASLRHAYRAVRERLSAATEPWRSRAREEAIGRWFAQREPIARRITSGECPDCRAALKQGDRHALCRACDVAFTLA